MSEQTTGSGVGRPLLAIGCVFAFFLCGGLGLAIGLVGWQANRQAQVMEELLETEDRFVELQVQVADPEEGGLFLVREPLRAAGPVPARYAVGQGRRPRRPLPGSRGASASATRTCAPAG